MSKKIRLVYEVDVEEFGAFDAAEAVEGTADASEGSVTLETVSDGALVEMARDRWGHDLSIFMTLCEVVRADGRRIRCIEIK